MDRRLIFPAVAITAWAQQPAPVPAETEAALRARVEQFFQLEVDKKFRQAEAFVAEDSKDDFYNGAKPNIKSFSIQGIEWMENNSRARVRTSQKVEVGTPFGAQAFELGGVTLWKVENSQWVWYIDHNAPIQTPFGPISPPRGGTAQGPGGPPPLPGKINPATLMNQVSLDRTSVSLSTSDPIQTVTVSNNLPGSVTLELEKPLLEGIAVELEKTELKTGESAPVRFRRVSETKVSGIVRLVASPLGKVFEISIQSK